MGSEIMEAGTKTNPVKLSAMSDDQKKRAATLFNILVMLWQKRALTFLRLTEPGNGYEAWRMMKQRMEANQPGRHLSML